MHDWAEVIANSIIGYSVTAKNKKNYKFYTNK